MRTGITSLQKNINILGFNKLNNKLYIKYECLYNILYYIFYIWMFPYVLIPRYRNSWWPLAFSTITRIYEDRWNSLYLPTIRISIIRVSLFRLWLSEMYKQLERWLACTSSTAQSELCSRVHSWARSMNQLRGLATIS